MLNQKSIHSLGGQNSEEIEFEPVALLQLEEEADHGGGLLGADSRDGDRDGDLQS